MSINSITSWSLLCIILAISACGSAPEQINANIELGNDIVAVIEKYSQQNGRFPDSLESLAPTYTLSIPPVFNRGAHSYGLSMVDGYYLCFQDSLQAPKCCYNPKIKDWDCSRGD